MSDTEDFDCSRISARSHSLMSEDGGEVNYEHENIFIKLDINRKPRALVCWPPSLVWVRMEILLLQTMGRGSKA